MKVRAVGTVDSPTPIVPISSDSTRVMSSRGPAARERRRDDPAGGAAAGDDDLLHDLPSMPSPSFLSVQAIEQHGAQPPRLHLVDRAQIAARGSGRCAPA
jgi:hypothetical protein